MSRHEGVSCDSCLKGNFRGRRYKCLICYDYDLCATCYEAGSNTTRHTADHAMQCILTRTDFDLYYGGEALPAEHPQSFTCPFCGKMGYTEALLQEHVTSEHTDTSAEVVCPICAAVPGGDPNHVTDDFAAHITLEHRAPREFEEPTGMRHVRRIPHPNRGAGSTRTRRSNMHFAGSAVAGLSPSSRETMDPIAELLSQLSSVRSRAAAAQSVSSQLQQLEMQLQSTRQQLERLPRRQPDASGLVVRPPTAVTNAAGVTTAATADLLSISNHNTNYSRANSQFLLARVSESPSCDVDQSSSTDVSLADRSLFVQELLLSTLTDHLHLNELSDIANSIAKSEVDVVSMATSEVVVAKGGGEACSDVDAAAAECSDNAKTEILISSDSDKSSISTSNSNSSSCSSLSESAVAIVTVIEDNKMTQRPPPSSESNENLTQLQPQTNTNSNNATRRRTTNSVGTNTTGTSMSTGSGVSLPPTTMQGQVMLQTGPGGGGGGTRMVTSLSSAASLGGHSGVVGLGSGNAPHPNRSLMAAAAVRDPRHNPTAAKRSLLKPHVEATKKTEPPH